MYYKTISLSASVLGALALGTVASAQTAFDPSFDTDIVVGADSSYNITGEVTISVNAEVIIDRPVFVTAGGHLIIQEGAVLRFQPADSVSASGYLCVSSDGTIDAEGTSTNPIIMTTAAAPDGSRWLSGAFMDVSPKTSPMLITGQDQLNLWGGFILLGNAPTNVGAVDDPDGPTVAVPGRAVIEGVGSLNDERVYYGGLNPNDNSGVVRYVSIRYSGQIISEGSEIQGLTIGGVGYGTTIEYIEVYGSGDDGIEVFGGTCGIKFLVLSYFDDDGFDLDQGFTGFAQFGLVISSNLATFNSDNLFEMDGDDDISDDEFNVSDDGRPLTYAQIANFTLIGHDVGHAGSAMRLRQGFGGDIFNSIVANVDNNVLRIENTGTANAALAGYPSARSEDRVAAGTLNLFSVSFYGIGAGNDALDNAIIANNTTLAPGASNNVLGALTAAAFGANNPANGGVTGTSPMNPVPFSAAVTTNVASYGATFFDSVNYRGAFPRSPSATLWTNGWTALNKTGFLVSNGLNQ